MDSTERKAASKLDRLETELNGYKTNLIKESIRMGHNDLGDFHYARGDLQVVGAALFPADDAPLARHVSHPCRLLRIACDSCLTTSAKRQSDACCAGTGACA